MKRAESGRSGPENDAGRRVEAERVASDGSHRGYLKEYLGERAAEHVEGVELMPADKLPKRFRAQLDFLGDDRLAETVIAVVPKGAWHKGAQPSESHVDRDLVLFEGGYFGGDDELAWLSHELTHCSQYKDGAEEYDQNMKAKAFADLSEAYPNNRIEEEAFTRQFEYLKSCGAERAGVREMLVAQYPDEDMPFLDRLLDKVF